MEKKTFKIMKKRILLIATVLVLTGCGSDDGDNYGFYQSEAYMEGFLLDKETGTMWVLTDGEWVNLGNPPTEAPNEGDSYKTELY
jgi:hypothetical protein